MIKACKSILKRIRNKWHRDILEKIDKLSPPPLLLPASCAIAEIQKSYAALQDDESRSLFLGRLEYSMTCGKNTPDGDMALLYSADGDMALLYSAMCKAGCAKRKSMYRYESDKYGIKNIFDLFFDGELKTGNKSIFLYGYNYDHVWYFLPLIRAANDFGFAIEGACFLNEIHLPDPLFEKINMMSEAELFEKGRDANFVLLCPPWWPVQLDNMVKKAMDKGIENTQLFMAHDYFFPQYFDTDIMVARDHEIFVDAGALDMGSTIDFVKWCNGQSDIVYAFECDPLAFNQCQENISKKAELQKLNIQLYRKGLAEKTGKVMLVEHFGSSKIDAHGTTAVEITSLDEVLNGKPVTFIKMDIEGAELDALKGARNTILKWKPRLAICLYHKPEDILEIPSFIVSLVPEYKMYIRHYSTLVTETVLLCVVR